jgi:hypothetical protein
MNMKRYISIFLSILSLLAVSCNKYDDSLVNDELNSAEKELTQMESKVSEMKKQIDAITALSGSNFISYISQDASGNYVISYKEKGGAVKTISFAVSGDIVKLPVISARKHTDGLLYWASTSDNGKTYTFILDGNSKMMPVGGTEPVLAIDANGYWTINGEVVKDMSGAPVLANDISNILFRSVVVENGLAVFTLADGTSFRVKIYESLNIAFDSSPVMAIPDRTVPAVIHYTISGSEAAGASVDWFTAYNTDVKINEYNKTITVTLDTGADEGNCVIMVTSGETTVLKPIFFTFGTAVISNPVWDTSYGTGTGISLPGIMTTFDIKVSANIAYDVKISDDCASWLKISPSSKADMVTKTHSFVADYYTNDSGADRKGTITFSNKPYGKTVTVTITQSPDVPVGPSVPGIANGADLVQFAKAVNAGLSTAKWQNSAGEIVLLNDIDLSKLTEWTPIGSGQATATPGYDALINPFTGVFNGQGYAIKGISWTFNTENGTTDLLGFFGALKNATIKNLVFGKEGDQITLLGSSSSVVAAGTLAGYAENSTFTNVKNNVNITLTGDNPSVLMMIGGVVGCVKTAVIGGESKEEGVFNYGNVTTGAISNTGNGGTGMNVGGICAFSMGLNTKLRYCFNYGGVSSPTGRGGGVMGSMGGSATDENPTTISNCSNYGTIQDDIVGQYKGDKTLYNYKRMGGLVGGTSDNANNLIEYCYNYGNVFSQLGCRTGGFVGHNKSRIVGCVNKGIILANISYGTDNTPQHGPGWACGYSGAKLISGCAKGGKVGEWDKFKDNPSAAPDATNDNALCYKNSTYFDPSVNY